MKKSKFNMLARTAKTKSAIKRRRLVIKQQRPLHKRFFLHPISVFLLLCVGVLLLGITFPVTADNLLVTAKVSAPFLTEPAVIESINGDSSAQTTELINTAIDTSHAIILKVNNITLGGTCPLDSYVSAFRNNVFAGSNICATDQTFSINIGLLPGLNVLKIQDYNLTDDPGPLTPQIYVYYDNTVPTSNVIQTVQQVGTPNIVSANPLLITSDTQSKIVHVGESLTWEIKIMGGTPPYTIFIDFGDNSNTTIVANKSGSLTFSHTYKQPGSNNDSYVIKIRIRDSSGVESFLQLLAIVRPNAGTGANTINVNDTSGWIPASVKRWLWLAWPAYGVVLLMVTSFWLGERQEIWLLRKPRRIIPKHHTR